MVAAIQLSLMLGAAAGGWLLDHFSIAATFMAGTVLLLSAAMIVKREQASVVRIDDEIKLIEECR